MISDCITLKEKIELVSRPWPFVRQETIVASISFKKDGMRWAVAVVFISPAFVSSF